MCLDVGASTGGFTDCLLQHGARRIIALDVGHNQIDWRLRIDPRVEVREGVNARYLRREDFDQQFKLVVMDVSFISATLVLPAVIEAAFSKAGQDAAQKKQIIVLVKPQFEVGRTLVGKRGIVRDPAAQLAAVEKVKQKLLELGARSTDFIESPILGAEGNRELLLYAIF